MGAASTAIIIIPAILFKKRAAGQKGLWENKETANDFSFSST